MNLDIRLPIGLMFTVFGVLLGAYGWLTRGSSIYPQHSLGINVNLWWGLALLVFGLAVLVFALARRKARE
jgi:hypothetical protein